MYYTSYIFEKILKECDNKIFELDNFYFKEWNQKVLAYNEFYVSIVSNLKGKIIILVKDTLNGKVITENENS